MGLFFDFDGDGLHEILYSDEEYFRIFGMVDGEVSALFSIVNPSGTLREFPVVADLDGDDSAEVILASNNYSLSGKYSSSPVDLETASETSGIRVFKSKNPSLWMPAKSAWHQYAFAPSMVDRDMAARHSLFKRKSTYKVYGDSQVLPGFQCGVEYDIE